MMIYRETVTVSRDYADDKLLKSKHILKMNDGHRDQAS